MRPRLFINHAPELDALIALEFGRVDDGQPDECWRVVNGRVGYLHDGPAGRPLGFKVPRFSEFGPEDPALAEIWDEPRFDAPLVGLTDASPGEIIVAARALVGDAPTVNRLIFGHATNLQGRRALEAWLHCLEAGDSMAHFGLGYTLYELGRYHEAYRHLRHYAEISPAQPWNLCWLGKAAEAVGELAEAEVAYAKAIAMTDAGADETDAPELLGALRVKRG